MQMPPIFNVCNISTFPFALQLVEHPESQLMDELYLNALDRSPTAIAYWDTLIKRNLSSYDWTIDDIFLTWLTLKYHSSFS